uniref:uncharacterized protein LOC120326449 isoform X2 n=1 Tax=Styela clava TaxID=7725 RepID=UPI0019393179|nr:uncharacterized protein LOC120326449 isoform X2 [Styela clava]
MDTYRVQLPHPQPVSNEEEFITNSGRRMKRPVVNITNNENVTETETDNHNEEHELRLLDGDDMLGSGLSVLSPNLEDELTARDHQLSSSIHAELHLSLDRLSENYDHDDIKRMQEKSKQSKRQLSVDRNMESVSPHSQQAADAKYIASRKESNLFKDSLDVDDQNIHQEINISDEDDHTIVADSLNYSSSREAATTPASKLSETSIPESIRTPIISKHHHLQNSEDKYADLRYNPNWRKIENTPHDNVEVASPVVIDFNDAPKLDDSLDQSTNSSRKGGGAIVVHKKELYSPVVPDWGNEKIPPFSSRSISPTRLSTDPVRLQQTNARLEEEYNRMLQAEISNSAGVNSQMETFPQQNPQKITPIQEEPPSPRKESYSVLIRKLDSQEQRTDTRDTAKVGGYQILPDRHRIPSPSRGPSSQDNNSPDRQKIPKRNSQQGRYKSPEPIQLDKNDPLLALSPREKVRKNVAPTPPKMPKPKNKDYIELNKQRLGRKTNSAGYLDLHNKRARQTDLVKARSQSELKGAVSQHQYHTAQQLSPIRHDENQFVDGTAEDIWSKQAQRLKVAKGENVNKGKIQRRPWIPRENGAAPAPSNIPNQPWNNNTTHNIMQHLSEEAWYSHNEEEFVETGVLDTRLHQQNNRNLMVNRRALPVPSQQNSQPNYRQISPRKDELMDSLNESGFKRAYFSPRMNMMNPAAQHESPLMKAYQSQYGGESHEGLGFTRRNEVLRQHFSEQNLNLPPRQNLSQRQTADIWRNPNDEEIFNPATLPPSNHSNMRNVNRKVTFLGDNEPIQLEGLMDEEPFSTSSVQPNGVGVYGLNRYRVPLPPTPPSKSLRHTIDRGRGRPVGKENVAVDDYFNVREDNYSVLPPILKSNQRNNSLKSSPNKETISPDRNGYLEQHERQRKKFQYKIYTLNDYKNLKKDVKLGGLGPDLESAREKHGNVEKAKQYAELIRREHMLTAKKITTDENEISFHDDTYHFSATMDDKQRKDMLDKRKRAIEYSKHVPRPKPKPAKPSSKDSNIASETPMSNFTSHRSLSNGPNEQNGIDFNFGLLEMLKERHEKEKAQVATFTGNS